MLYIVVSLDAHRPGALRPTLNVAHPVAFAVEQIQRLSWLRPFITIGAVLGLGSVVLVMLLGQSRVFYSMSRDGLIGPWAGKVHPRFRTPYLSTIYVGLIVAVITGTFPIQILGELVNIGTLLAFVLVCAGVMILRKTRPDLERPFRTPLVPLVPILGMLACFGLMATLPADTWLRLFVWLLIGFVVYFSYGRKHSVLQKERGGRRRAGGRSDGQAVRGQVGLSVQSGRANRRAVVTLSGAKGACLNACPLRCAQGDGLARTANLRTDRLTV